MFNLTLFALTAGWWRNSVRLQKRNDSSCGGAGVEVNFVKNASLGIFPPCNLFIEWKGNYHKCFFVSFFICWWCMASGCCVEPISQLIKCKGRKIVWQQSIEGKRNEEPAAPALEEEFVIRHFKGWWCLWGKGQGSYHHHSLATHCMSFWWNESLRES